ncbi:hypothetical protein [Burkholderia multivorans]|uniref:hypothetical protein n=1 Tax=Burkholderia multivorans TaxID=87883 RepID=UPI0021BFDA12|nr:hypothetical protein [Burkholderia multivorans]MDR9177898.1 hypothetical protein [Burkholderia multivorans]MDR9184016.1 hypothetical protein [Burkholderia multivorans]MDR9187488.1 hypothetical protein [Burkholderia multivorans]MDR9195224.1 hypothetical protein [Burkholderia multivorans]MDR9200920.1 hypothetical protein [Burkholderia multivorans]
MATQNDFLPFATGPGANVVDQATYAALSALTTGFLSGTAQSVQLNKVWRQSSIMAAIIAQFIVAQTGQAAVDDGTTATLLANFTKAVNAASKQRVILSDSGSVNAYAAANPVPMTSLPTVSGIVQTISVKTTNTGASTYSPDGLASRPIFGLGGSALQGGEMVANGIATLVSYVGPLLNGGSLCWVLFECIGGAQQVAPATQAQHAMQLAQATGRLLRISVYRNNGGTLQVSVNGAAFANASNTFSPLSATASVRVRAVGAGGGSGGVPATGSSQYGASAGAQGGAYAEGWYSSGFSGALISVGAGGAGGAAGANNGANGGSTSFGSLISCPGGLGTQAGTVVSTSTPLWVGGGAISQSLASGGFVNTGVFSGNNSFGSGTGALAVGAGGNSPFGSGGITIPSGGFPGAGYGAGASGVGIGASTAAIAGQSGSSGCLIIEELS